MVIIDSGAAASVVQSYISHFLNNILPSTLCVAIAADGNSLVCLDKGIWALCQTIKFLMTDRQTRQDPLKAAT